MKRILARRQESGSWVASSSSSSTSGPSGSLKKPTGLLNLGNSCYLNSVVQCLTYTPPLANFCLTKQHSSSCTLSENDSCPFCMVERRIVRSRKVVATVDSANQIKNSLHIIAKHFVAGRQEDAHEFMTYLLDVCNDVCLQQQNGEAEDGQNELPDTIIKKIFGGVLQSQVKCLTCGANSNKRDDIMDLSLELPEEATSLQKALSCYFASQFLDRDNLYRCEKCQNLTEARKQMSIFRPSNVLVIQLKRFISSPFGQKIRRAISFTKCLKLGEFMSPEESIHEAHQVLDYSLFATIIHEGYSQNSGHYFAYVKDENERWYRCSDSKVTPVSEEKVLKDEQVYLLFFLRSVPLETGNGMSNISSGDENLSVKGKLRTPSDRSDDGQTDEEYGKRPSKFQKRAQQ